MKKKIIYGAIFILAFVISINTVQASGFTSDVRYNICGIDNVPENVPMLTSGLYNLVKISVPIILIVMGIVDLVGAVSAADTDKMKKAQKKLITRLIAAVFIFFIMAIVQFIFKKVDNGETGFWNCMNCILSKECNGESTHKSYTLCKDRGQSTCVSDGDSDALGHKCMYDGETRTCIDDCSSFTSATTCPRAYCVWNQINTSGECKKKNKVKVAPSTSNNLKSSGTTGNTTNGTMGGTTTTTTTTTTEKDSCLKKCETYSGSAKSQCESGCNSLGGTTTTTTEKDSCLKKCETYSGSAKSQCESGCKGSSGTTTTTTEKSTCLKKCETYSGTAKSQCESGCKGSSGTTTPTANLSTSLNNTATNTLKAPVKCNFGFVECTNSLNSNFCKWQYGKCTSK